MSKALITGASSGIGREIAMILSERGYDLILVARRTARMEELKQQLQTDVRIITADLSDPQSCFDLYEQTRNEEIDVLVNNAGFGLHGAFAETDLNTELNMIDLNIKAVHILTKLFVRDFIAKDCGYILNVASAAAFIPGPFSETYYATKGYVLRLSADLNRELKEAGSNVSVSAFCPGPVATEFTDHLDVGPSFRQRNCRFASERAVCGMFRRKTVITPGFNEKLVHLAGKFLPDALQSKISYSIQQKRK